MGWLEFIGVTVLGALVGAVITIVCRKIPIGHREDDAQTGIKLTGLYTVFAVILGFVILSSWQFYAEAADSVRSEAAAVSVINRNAGALPAGLGVPVEAALRDYLAATINTEWPVGQRGVSPAASALENLNRSIVELPVQRSVAISNTQDTMLYYLGQLEMSRAERVFFAEDEDPDFVWGFLLVGGGAVIILSATLHFRSRGLHILLVASMSAIFAASLFSVYALNHPFSGPFPVSPDSLKLAQETVTVLSVS